MGERVIGHIEGIVPGADFHRRVDVKRANLHRDTMRGISWLADEDGSDVADAIVLNGGYEDDEDDWTSIRYTGASPDKDKSPDGKRLIRSQSWEYRDNAALKRSFERGYPVRIIRGPNGDRRYSLADRYRYDGLYRITDVRTAVSRSAAPDGSPIKICQFDLERLPSPEQELTSAERVAAQVLERQEGFVRDELKHANGEQGAALEGEKFPKIRATRVQRIVRDAAAARRIKDLYNDECQACGLRIVGSDAKPYSEGAHIKPLGKPHGGPDVERNILCLCPNCHVRLDIGAIVIADDWSIVVRVAVPGERILPKLKMHREHKVHPEYLQYHRDLWEKGTGASADQ
ncbi:YDG/SRA domain-containing protein [Streptomyces poonensis]|uniref:YDG/SRA domain-containing protein n=1 Tax=Streptomyces poonensis TaxID=68255 RepID=UPI00167660CE|nr:YDG/SRA domain-containing protein [Streptomyces poonensis]